MLCVTTITVVAVAPTARGSRCRSAPRLSASSALNGSSSRSTDGPLASARAIATRWRIPPRHPAGPGRLEPLEADQPEKQGGACLTLGPRVAGQRERIGDVGQCIAPRQQARLLEDEAPPDPARRPAGRRSRPTRHPPRQATDDPQERALAASVRTDDRHDLPAGTSSRSSPSRATSGAPSAAAKFRRDARQVDRGRAHRRPVGAPLAAGLMTGGSGRGGLRLRRRQPRLAGQEVGLVGPLPGQVEIRPAEMAVRRGLAIDRPAQVEGRDDARRAEIEMPLDQGQDRVVRDPAGAEGVDAQAIGRAMPMP